MLSLIYIYIIQFISIYAIIYWLLVYLENRTKEETPKELINFPTVTITVPSYNEENTIKETVESLQNLDYPKDKLNIYVVNDCSTDNTKKIVESLLKNYDNLHIINNEKNIGKAASLNKVLNITKAEIFICQDADSFIASDALKKMLPHFKDQKVAAVVPIVSVRNTSKLLLKFQWIEYISNFFFKKLMSHIDCVHVTPGPFSVFKREILKKIGGFDEGNITEDLEIALRIQKNHYRIVQVLDAVATTIAPETIKGFYKQRNRWLKGALLNLYKYKSLIFNKEYKEFGLFELPILIFALIASLSISFIFLYEFLSYLFKAIIKIPNYNLSYIFDIVYHIKSFFSNFYLLDIFSINKFLFLYILIFLGGIFLVLAFRTLKKSIITHGITPIVYYLIFYPIVVSIIWTGVIIDLARNKVQKW